MYTNVHIYIYIYIYTTIVIYTYTIIYTVYTYDYISHYTTKFLWEVCATLLQHQIHVKQIDLYSATSIQVCSVYPNEPTTPNAQPKFLNAQQHLQCPMFHRPIRSVIHHKS